MSCWRTTQEGLPPYGLVVWARCGGGQPFKAVRILHKKRRKSVWGRQRARGRVQLLRAPPDVWAGIDARVEPEGPDPEPPAFSVFARPRVATPSTDIIESRQWWLDACNVTYSAAGAVTPREAEGRVLRALVTAKAAKPESPRGNGSNSDWIARMIAKVEREQGKRATYWHDRFQPTARDMSGSAVVLEWITGLWLFDKRYYVALTMRAADPPYSFRQIGEAPLFKCSEGTARRIYRLAIAFAVRRANGVRLRHAAA